MTVRDMLQPLTHVVQVRERPRGPDGPEWWETIAAFNAERVAGAFTQCCRMATGRAYRVEPIIWPEGG